jgi:hypothetical protein
LAVTIICLVGVGHSRAQGLLGRTNVALSNLLYRFLRSIAYPSTGQHLVEESGPQGQNAFDRGAEDGPASYFRLQFH